MSKCLKCGAALPPVGECPACAAAAADATQPGGTTVPSLLDKDIHIDRRRTPERTPAVTGPTVPSFADLERAPATPPGLAPARPAAAPAQPPAMTPAARTQTPPMGSQTHAAPQPPAMTPAQRPPLPPSMPAAQAAVRPQAVPPPQRIPVPAPASAPPPQRIPVPAPHAAQRVPPPGAPVPPPGAPVPPPGAPVPPPFSRAAAAGDPDTTAPGQSPFPTARPPAPAPMPAHAAPPVPRPGIPAPAMSQAAAGDPDDTAPGQPSFASMPPPAPPSAMASPAQRAELPVAPAPRQAPPLAPEPGTASRHHPSPVSVVTFSPPPRPPAPPPPHGVLPTDEHLTPRLPLPIPPPLESPAAAQQRARPSSTGVQEIHARPASLWRRLLSFTIDTAAIVGVAALYITLASSIAGVKAPSSQGLTALDSIAAWMHALKAVLLPGAVLLLVLAAVYCAVAAFLWNGRTLGRLLLGLRLVDTHGVAPAPTRAIVRAILSVVSFGLFLGGFWMALFDKRGQTLHDKLTSTFVIQPS